MTHHAHLDIKSSNFFVFSDKLLFTRIVTRELHIFPSKDIGHLVHFFEIDLLNSFIQLICPLS